MKKLLVAVAVTVLAIPVSATIRTVTLVVPSMDCPVCPITVKKVLTQLDRKSTRLNSSHG